jgi:hypothetical protein
MFHLKKILVLMKKYVQKVFSSLFISDYNFFSNRLEFQKQWEVEIKWKTALFHELIQNLAFHSLLFVMVIEEGKHLVMLPDQLLFHIFLQKQILLQNIS